jgi:hypothetical protein
MKDKKKLVEEISILADCKELDHIGSYYECFDIAIKIMALEEQRKTNVHLANIGHYLKISNINFNKQKQQL